MEQVAIITGASRGIGLSYAWALLSRGGWAVVLLDVVGADVSAADLCLKFGAGKAVGFACDVAVVTEFRAAWVRSKAIGPVRLLVHNAGIADVLFARAERILAVNLGAVIFGTELAVHDATDGLTRRAAQRLDVVCTASSF